jgi:hypothetical protein
LSAIARRPFALFFQRLNSDPRLPAFAASVHKRDQLSENEQHHADESLTPRSMHVD